MMTGDVIATFSLGCLAAPAGVSARVSTMTGLVIATFSALLLSRTEVLSPKMKPAICVWVAKHTVSNVTGWASVQLTPATTYT